MVQCGCVNTAGCKAMRHSSLQRGQSPAVRPRTPDIRSPWVPSGRTPDSLGGPPSLTPPHDVAFLGQVASRAACRFPVDDHDNTLFISHHGSLRSPFPCCSGGWRRGRLSCSGAGGPFPWCARRQEVGLEGLRYAHHVSTLPLV